MRRLVCGELWKRTGMGVLELGASVGSVRFFVYG